MEKHCVIPKQVDYATELTGGIIKMVANDISKQVMHLSKQENSLWKKITVANAPFGK